MSLLMDGGGSPPWNLVFSKEISHRFWSDFKGFIKRHSLIQQGSAVLAAVSGGPDSLCLLHLLFVLRDKWDLRLAAAHFEHGLRGEQSLKEMEFVEEVCRRNSIEFFSERCTSLKGRSNLQAEARRLRYDFFRRIMKREGFDCTATGHTADDQAEELLYRLIRGSSLAGLSGIRVKRQDGIVRPILCLTRERIERHLRRSGMAWMTDPTNLKGSYVRNRIRQRLIPVIKEEFSPAFPEAALRTSMLLSQDEEALGRWAEEALKGCERSCPPLLSCPGAICLDRRALMGLPQAVRRRVFRKVLLERLDLQADRLLSDHLLHLDHLCSSSRGQKGYPLPGRLEARRSGDFIILGRFAGADEGAAALRGFKPVLIRAPGEAHALGPDMQIVIFEIRAPETIFQKKAEHGRGPEAFDFPKRLFAAADRVEWPLLARTRRPGDRFWPLGAPGPVKLKRFLINRKIPRTLRDAVPLLTGPGGQVVAVCGLEVAHPFRCRRPGEAALSIELSLEAAQPR